MMARGRNPQRSPLPAAVPKAEKRDAGATAAPQTPLNLRVSGVRLDAATRAHAHKRMGRQLGRFAPHVERATVRFFDVNGPRGGVDQTCRIKVVLSRLPSVVVEANAATAREAFDRAAASTARAVKRSLGRAADTTGLPRRRAAKAAHRAAAADAVSGPGERVQPMPDDGSLIGRRVGRSRENLERAAERPEKSRRDVPVDTAQPRRSATDRKAGGGSTARRNTKLEDSGLSATLEDSAQERPSRKPTRRSTDRSRQDTGLHIREVAATRSPSARARRGGPREGGSSPG
jgi:hypothetical protein